MSRLVALSVTLLIASVTLLGGQAVAAAAESDDPLAQALDLTNAQRQTAGLAPLALSPELAQAAQSYARVLGTSGCFAHTCGPVPDFAQRITQAGFTGWTAIGENIGCGFPGPDAMVNAWMDSPQHRANILNPQFTEFGMGVAPGPAGSASPCWSQEFGNRLGGPPNASPPADPSAGGGDGEQPSV